MSDTIRYNFMKKKATLVYAKDVNYLLLVPLVLCNLQLDISQEVFTHVHTYRCRISRNLTTPPIITALKISPHFQENQSNKRPPLNCRRTDYK